MGYGLEVDMIRKAHERDMLTTPYVFSADEAVAMTKAGADMIVPHMGLTTGGSIGAETSLKLADCPAIIDEWAEAAKRVRKDVMVICHGGPISSPADAAYILKTASMCTASMGQARWSACHGSGAHPADKSLQEDFILGRNQWHGPMRAGSSRRRLKRSGAWCAISMGLPTWAVGIVDLKIEGGLDADVVGCVRSFHTKDGTHIRERLLTLDDARYSFTYNFEKPAFPVNNYIATLRLMPVTNGDATFAEWEATFDEAPGDEGKYVAKISKDVFAANWKSLSDKIKREKPEKPEGSVRWKALGARQGVDLAGDQGACRPGVEQMRDFAGMGAWHGEITKMHMLKKARSDKVSGVRDFYFGDGHLN